MSVDKIVDYAMKTPQNTNPSILRSLVKGIVDENTLAMAKAYTDSQRLAYVEFVREHAIDPFVIGAGETAKTKLSARSDCLIEGARYIITINGVEYESVLILDGSYYYLGNRSIFGTGDPNTGEGYVVRIRSAGGVVSANQIRLSEATVEDTTVTVELESEVVHLIDPKYLPKQDSNGLPVVEFTTQYHRYGGLMRLTEAEVNQLNETEKSGLPIIAKFDMDGNAITTIMTYYRSSQYDATYSCTDPVWQDWPIIIERSEDNPDWHFYADPGE